MSSKTIPVEVKSTPTPRLIEQRSPFHLLQQQISRLFENFEHDGFGSHWRDVMPFTKFGSDIMPAMDVIDDGDCYQLTAELPGLSEKDIDVTKDGDFLIVKGEKKEKHERKEKGYFMAERHYGSFERCLRLPNGVDESQIDAKFDKGVLTVTLPKTAAAKLAPRKIAVKAA